MSKASPKGERGHVSGADTDERLIGQWLAAKPSPHTRRAYARAVADFRAGVGQAPLAEITVADLRAWKADLEARLAPASVQACLAAVRSLLAYAQRTGYLPFNVGAAVPPPAVPNRLAERILAERDVLNLLAAADGRTQGPRNRALLHFLYYTGARTSEALTLRWRDIQATPHGKAAALHGKGGQTRHVALVPDLAALLDALRPHPPEPDAPVFATASGRAVILPEAIRILRAAARRAGLAQADRISPHWLRHAHATHALERGAPAHEVQQTLGHASLTTTSRYVHMRPERSSGHRLAGAGACTSHPHASTRP